VSRQVRLEPEAEEELVAAAAHYDRQVSGLGQEFVAATSAAIRRLRSWPNSGSPLESVDPALSVRRVPVPRFPYQLVYVRFGDDVHVVAVAHDSRRPGYWTERIRQ
jgi:toxin ParE1/3/4